MRSITPSLLLAQRARTILGKHLLIRCVLTYGATTYTYNTTRIKQLSRIEQYFSHKAELMLEDSDKTLHGLDLEGYKAVISRGLITKAGEEWVALPPLWVYGQQRDSYRSHLECSLSLEGIFDRMGKHKAESVYTLDSSDTQTVKTLLTAIAEATLAPYTNYPAYTITFDSEDDLIDTFIPADSFRINKNETRRAKFQELLNYTDCVARVENDGAIHIRVPVTSGTTYDNEYTLVEGRDYQNFFNKRFRRRIVSPNYIIYEDYDGTYTGYAKDASADLTDMLERETHTVRATSDAQCTNLATAHLSKLQMAAEKGAGVLPFVHFGQELYDYVNFVDARAGDNRAGNVGSIVEFYQPGQFNMNIGFGKAPIGVRPLEGYATEAGMSWEQIRPFLFELQRWILECLSWAEINQENIKTLFEAYNSQWEDAYFKKLTVTERFRRPIGRVVYLQVIADDTTLTTGDGKMIFTVPPALNGAELVDADAMVYIASTSGLPTIQIANITDAVDMLSTRITIDPNEDNSYTATTPPVIDTTKDDVATADILRIDVDGAGTGAKGLSVVLTFRLPLE